MQEYRLVMQYKSTEGRFINNGIIISGRIKEPKDILDLGLRHNEQIEILQKIQDSILNKQSEYLKEDINYCPKCGHKLHKNGINKCSFNSVFTDHKIPVHRQLCGNCKWSSVPSINSLFGSHMHPDLMKLQCEEASKQSYTKAKVSLNLKACKTRKVNSTMTIHGVVETVGNYISQNPSQDFSEVRPAKTLVVQVDGGHIKSKAQGSRSFEAMTSVIYKPENVEESGKKERGVIVSKHCAASALDDKQAQIRKQTLIAAKKEGMTKDTELVAISDGAANCWSVIDYLKEHCKSITAILDWFHIAMKFQNIGKLQSEASRELLESAKWSLWHGNIELFTERMTKLIEQATNIKLQKKFRVRWPNLSRLKIRNYEI